MKCLIISDLLLIVKELDNLDCTQNAFGKCVRAHARDLKFKHLKF
jgi:hypothetical protein